MVKVPKLLVVALLATCIAVGLSSMAVSWVSAAEAEAAYGGCSNVLRCRNLGNPCVEGQEMDDCHDNDGTCIDADEGAYCGLAQYEQREAWTCYVQHYHHPEVNRCWLVEPATWEVNYCKCTGKPLDDCVKAEVYEDCGDYAIQCWTVPPP
ncbi:MAG: hypothetical protein ACYTEL_18705 [Planctomycetota bacterium]